MYTNNERRNQLPPIFTRWLEYYSFLIRANNAPIENEKVVQYVYHISGAESDVYINTMQHVHAMCFIELMELLPTTDNLHRLIHIVWADHTTDSNYKTNINAFLNKLLINEKG